MSDNSFRLHANSEGYCQTLHPDFCANNQRDFSLFPWWFIRSDIITRMFTGAIVKAEPVKYNQLSRNVFAKIYFNIIFPYDCRSKKWTISKRVYGLNSVCRS
jgi:hypothetical protein